MKIIQINAWCGRLSGPLTRFLKAEHPDIICMQEAFDPAAKFFEIFKDQYDFVNEIIGATGLEHQFFTPDWGFEMAGSKIDLGNIILSKFPLSNFQAFHTYGKYHMRSVTNAIANTRVWHACTATLPEGRSLQLANYQGYVAGMDSNGDKTTAKTLKKVREGLEKLEGPLIFCADLNINPDAPALRVLDELGLRNLTVEHNIPTTLSSMHRAPERDRLSVACDYIFVSNGVKVKDFHISDELISDHKALVLEFDI